MTPPNSLKAHSPADLLVMVPALAGFTPHDSVVMVMFRGRFTVGAFRYGLPDPDSPLIVLKRACHRSDGHALQDARGDRGRAGDPHGRPAPDDVTPPIAALAEVIIRRLQHAGFELRDALWQSGDGWGTYCRPA